MRNITITDSEGVPSHIQTIQLWLDEEAFYVEFCTGIKCMFGMEKVVRTVIGGWNPDLSDIYEDGFAAITELVDSNKDGLRDLVYARGGGS